MRKHYEKQMMPLLAAALSVLLLCSCGTQNTASEQDAVPSQTEDAGTAAEQKTEETLIPSDSKTEDAGHEAETAASALPAAEDEVLQDRLIKPVLNWYPGTAGSSLKLAVAATEVLSFAAEYDGAVSISSEWNALPDEEKQRFEENVDEIAELLETTEKDYVSVSGLYEDAGVGETAKQLCMREGIWENWQLLRWCLKNPTVELGSSLEFTNADRQAAAEVILAEFAGWQGCVMHRLWYTSDEENNPDNIRWMNELAAANGPDPDFTEVIHFRSDFHSPVSTDPEITGAWNPDEEYEDWGWWLARAASGEWRLMTWGWG